MVGAGPDGGPEQMIVGNVPRLGTGEVSVRGDGFVIFGCY